LLKSGVTHYCGAPTVQVRWYWHLLMIHPHKVSLADWAH
jgi:hypothetical protein